MTKLTLPKGKFSHDLTAAPVDTAMKDAQATTAKLYRVPVDKIKTIPGFNVRVQSADYIAHRDAIRHSIAVNGYDSTKPLAGYVAKEDGENVIYVTDGHTRLDAVREFNADPDTAEKNEIATLPVLVQPKEVSLTDLTVQLHTANNGRPLTPFELGVVVKRLLADEDAKKPEIAKRLGVTTRYLDDVLLLANADGKVKQHVAAGEVSSTMAIQVLRKDPEHAAEKIEAAVAKATASGKKKATKKDTGPRFEKIKVNFNYAAGADMKEIVKQAAAIIRESIPQDEADDVKTANVTGFITVTVEVPAAKVEKPKAEPEVEAAKKKAEKPKAKSEDKTGKKSKAKVGTDEAAKPKPAKGKKPVKKAKAEKPADEGDDLGIAGAEPLDGEPARLPPKVPSDDIDDVDI